MVYWRSLKETARIHEKRFLGGSARNSGTAKFDEPAKNSFLPKYIFFFKKKKKKKKKKNIFFFRRNDPRNPAQEQRVFTFVFTDAVSEKKDPGACRSSKRPNRDAVFQRRKIDSMKEKETDIIRTRRCGSRNSVTKRTFFCFFLCFRNSAYLHSYLLTQFQRKRN